MDTELIAHFLRERLQATEQMQNAAALIGVSVATMYRYRANPESMPLGKLSALAKYLGLPLAGTAHWSKTNVVQSEQRRWELESKVGDEGGIRYVVTPAFSVNCEVPELTAELWKNDYPMASAKEFEGYSKLHEKRRTLYLSGTYKSFEIIIASCYRDFFNRRGRFKGIPEATWKEQYHAIIQTTSLSHIHRRVYLQNTPELPTFTCYSNNAAVVRVDDFTVEFAGPGVVSELTEIFVSYFEGAEVKTNAQTQAFLQSPN